MTPDRVEDMLYLWKRWMHGGKSKHLGYPTRSSTGDVQVDNAEFDQMVAEADDRCARATDAAIDELPANNKAAVYRKHLGGPFAGSANVLEAYYVVAVALLGRALDRRGIA